MSRGRLGDHPDPMRSNREQAADGAAVGQRIGASAAWRDLPRPQRLRIGGCVAYVVLLTLLFIRPLTRLMLYAADSDVHPHILLVPLVTAYLLYVKRRPVSAGYRSSILGTVTVGGIGLAALAAGIGWRGNVSLNDELALMALAYVSFVAAGVFLFLGSKWMAAAAFPAALLIFMVPLPDAARHWLERASALASAEAAAPYFNMAGTPFVRHGTVFELPGIALEVG